MHEALLDACWLTWTPDRRILRAEGACEKVLRRPGAELVGQPLTAALGIKESVAQELDRRARSARPAPPEFANVELAGHAAVLRIQPALQDGEAAAAVVDLEQLLAGAPPLQISKLASSLSHEIRNPLSSVKMAVQTLARNPSMSERDQRRLSIANREIRTMERMLGLLSEYGRELAPSLEAVPLRSVIQDAAALVLPELSEKHISLSISEGAEPRAKVDPLRLRLVIAQLLLNVAMGLEDGQPLPIALREGDGVAILQVTDPVATVPPEERETLFEPFGSRLARGAGLSLAALRRALHAQGAEVKVEPQAPQGAIFTLTFPS